MPSRRDEPAFILGSLDGTALVLRQHFGDHIVDPQFSGHCLGRRSAISGEHDDADVFTVQLPNRLRSSRLDRIGDTDQSGELAVHSHEQFSDIW